MKRTIKKTAIITGASKGIGRQVALKLAKSGYLLSLVARSKTLLYSLAEEITEINKLSEEDKPLIFPLDVIDETQVNAAILNTIEKRKRIDVLFNGAGIFEVGTVDMSLDKIYSVLNTNLVGPINFIKAVKPFMEKQRSGYIINMASRSGKFARPSGGIYAASKFGLIGLSESLYQEMAKFNVKVTTICPGAVNTDMTVLSNIPEKNKIKSEDIAKIVRHLLSLSNAAYIKEYVLDCYADASENQQRALINS